MTSPIKDYGWEPVPRSFEQLLASRIEIKKAEPLKVEDIKLPNTKLAGDIIEYARKELPAETFNHSMRVFYYGMPYLFDCMITSLMSSCGKKEER